MKHANNTNIKPMDTRSFYIKPVCLSLLISGVLLLTTQMHWFAFALSNVLLLLTSLFIYLSQYKKVMTYLWEITCAFLGFFLGFYLDFGITDLHVLYEICGQGNMLILAPITCVGMLLGCNFGILISSKSSNNLGRRLFHLLSLNLGMLIGMLVFERLDNLMTLFNAPLSILIHLLSMIFFGHIVSLCFISISYKLIDPQSPPLK